MVEKSRRNRNRIAATAAIAFVALGGAANASTGGATFDKNPPPIPQTDSNGACPKVEKITSKTAISARCQKFLFKTLSNSVYDSTDTSHRVAAYQAVAGLNDVDGVAGPDTTRSILQGKALKVAVPNSRFTKQPGVLIDKSDQVAYFMTKSKFTGKSKVSHILKIATGTEQDYNETVTLKNGTTKQVSGTADTPTGNFTINRIEGAGYDQSDLGPMPYARFINHPDGIALHSGNVSVTGRQSHGCIRVPASDMVTYAAPMVGMNTAVTIRE